MENNEIMTEEVTENVEEVSENNTSDTIKSIAALGGIMVIGGVVGYATGVATHWAVGKLIDAKDAVVDKIRTRRAQKKLQADNTDSESESEE